jgi:hypothetical protein
MSSRKHVISGDFASSISFLASSNGSEIIAAGETMEDDHRDVAGDGCHLTFVFFSSS